MEPSPPTSTSSGFSNFPILAIALLSIAVTAFLLISYYLLVFKCCLSLPRLQPLRRLSFRTFPFSDHPSSSAPRRGLDSLVLRNIPTFKYTATTTVTGCTSFRKCAVCLSSFEEQELLRALPHCGHVFHLDCIDIWLMNNANCPLCRSIITGTPDHTINNEIVVYDNELVVIEVGSGLGNSINSRRFSAMGDDQCIGIRVKDHEGMEVNQPIRRSFSMDSVVDRRLLLQVQQMMRESRRMSNEVGSSSGDVNGGSVRGSRSFFSFRQGRGSKSAVLPIESDL